MKNLFLFNLFIGILLFGCSENRDSNDYHPLKLNVELKKYKDISNIKNIFEMVDTIQLDNNDEAILGYAGEANNFNTDFVIADPIGVKTVKVFNDEGVFLQNVGGKGQGPEEYISPDLLAVNDKYLAIYDPAQQKIILFNDRFEYIKSWKVKYYVERIAIDNRDRIVVLRKPGYGYDHDLDLYNLQGNLKHSIVLPKSSREKNRRFLFGGSYKIAVQNNRIYYIGADEFKILCYNLEEEGIEWASNELPDIIKIPDIPLDMNSSKRISWMKQNYTALMGFYIFKNGLQIVHIPNHFLLYDNHGNYLSNVKVEDKSKIFFSNANNLYAVTFPFKTNYGKVSNPQIITYRIKDSSI